MRIPREKLTLTKSQAQEIISRDDLNFEVIKKEIASKSRWSIEYEIIVKRKSDGKYFRDFYQIGATEHQEESPYDNSDPDFEEVFPVERMVIDYE